MDAIGRRRPTGAYVPRVSLPAPVVAKPPVQAPEPGPFAEPAPVEAPRATKKRKEPRPHAKRRRWIIAGTALAVVILIPAVALAIMVKPVAHSKFAPAGLVLSAAKAALGDKTVLKGQTSGRTNIAVYGMTKDGLRTDSIILISYYWAQKKMVMLNIPRDLYVNDGYENDKMGEVYAYAKGRQPHNPTYPDTFVASLLSKEYGIPIDYYVQLNMEGEVQLVNAIGGVNINVPDTFTDCEYPTWNYSGYIRPCPHFNAGPQQMNGDTALIYSRSRHSLDNNEGTDFARSKRQQQLVQAILGKVKTMGILGNLAELNSYLTILGNNVSTNMSTDEMISFSDVAKGLNTSTDVVPANWAVGDGFLCSSTSSYGAYITEYGVPGSCGVQAGGTQDSKYRELAIYFVQNMLTSAPMSYQQFITAATAAQAATASPSPSASTGPAPAFAPTQ
jgi:LCP family protein required for cell wall assembly